MVTIEISRLDTLEEMDSDIKVELVKSIIIVTMTDLSSSKVAYWEITKKNKNNYLDDLFLIKKIIKNVVQPIISISVGTTTNFALTSGNDSTTRAMQARIAMPMSA
jgi:hypothetical protein